MAAKRIALLVPDMPTREELAPYLARIDQARWYTNFGPLATELERRLGAALGAGAAGAVSVANATLGLELALLAHRLPARARVLLPALTFVASAASVRRAGLEPVFCDVDARSWLLTPEIARRALRSAQAAAVMPVTTYGHPQPAAPWDQFAVETGCPVVIDAAGAYGNQSGPSAACQVFSLHATKSLGAGEGGFALSTDAALLARIRRLSNFGIDVSTGDVEDAGTNAKLSEYHAAAALASLDGWEARRARRVALHRRYLAALAAHCPSVALQERDAGGVYSILPVLLPEKRDAREVARRLAAEGIETRRWYCPTLERHPAFRGCALAGPLEVCASLNDRLLALPFHVQLEDAEIETVCRALGRAAT
jgi:dTDP-4-amino-4,6-dideoxygalactose transaminase